MTLDKNSRFARRQRAITQHPTPNKFTVAMGESIWKARENASMGQKELAEKIYRCQATLSDLENGKSEVEADTLVLNSTALDKPITNFFPCFVYQELRPEKFTPLEHELLEKSNTTWDDHLHRVAINLVQAIETFNP